MTPPVRCCRGFRQGFHLIRAVRIASLNHVVVIVPLLWCHPPDFRELTVFINHATGDGVEDLLRIDGTTRSAHGLVRLNLVRHLLQVAQAFQWIVLVNGVPTYIEQKQSIKQFEDIRTWLVDDDKHNLSTQGQLLQNVHDVFAVPTGEPTRRLVYKKDRWFTDQFQGNVQAFALSSRNRFIHDGTHTQIPNFPKPQTPQRRFNAFQSFFLGRTAQTQLRAEFEVFIHCQFADEHVLLGNVPKAAFGQRAFLKNGVPVHEYVSKRWTHGTVQDVEQRRFPRPTRPHDTNQVSGLGFNGQRP